MFCLLNTDVHTSSFIYIFIGTQLILLFFFSKIKKKKKAKWNVQALGACLILYDRFYNIIVIPKESSINCYCSTYYYIEIWPLELS